MAILNASAYSYLGVLFGRTSKGHISYLYSIRIFIWKFFGFIFDLKVTVLRTHGSNPYSFRFDYDIQLIVRNTD